MKTIRIIFFLTIFNIAGLYAAYTNDADIEAILTDTADMQPKIGSVTGFTPQTLAGGIAEVQTLLGSPAGASISADIAAVKAETASILTDTAAMQPTVATNLDTTVSSRASQASVNTVDTNVDAILIDTADMQPKIGSVTGFTPQTLAGGIAEVQTLLGSPAGASVSADIAAVKAETASILTDTAAMQPTVATNLDTTVSSRASQASVNTIDTNVDAILIDTAAMQPTVATNLDTTVSSRASQASVNTIDTNVDAILIDTADMQPKIGSVTGFTPQTLAGGISTLQTRLGTPVASGTVALKTDGLQCTALVSATSTLTTAGTYCVTADITGTITIEGSDIVLDLNGHVISGATNGVVIDASAATGSGANLSNIIVKNGTLKPSSGAGIVITTDGSFKAYNVRFEDIVIGDITGSTAVVGGGILIGSGCTDLTFNNVSLFNITGGNTGVAGSNGLLSISHGGAGGGTAGSGGGNGGVGAGGSVGGVGNFGGGGGGSNSSVYEGGGGGGGAGGAGGVGDAGTGGTGSVGISVGSSCQDIILNNIVISTVTGGAGNLIGCGGGGAAGILFLSTCSRIRMRNISIDTISGGAGDSTGNNKGSGGGGGAAGIYFSSSAANINMSNIRVAGIQGGDGGASGTSFGGSGGGGAGVAIHIDTSCSDIVQRNINIIPLTSGATNSTAGGTSSASGSGNVGAFGQGKGFLAHNASSNIVWREGVLEGCNARAIDLIGTTGNEITDVQISDVSMIGCATSTSISDYVMQIDFCNRLQVRNCRLLNNGNATRALSVIRFDDSNQCFFENIEISGNQGASTGTIGINIDAGTAAQGNIFRNVAILQNTCSAGTLAGFDLSANVSGNLFERCQIIENAGTTIFKGFVLSGSNSSNIYTDCVISRNSSTSGVCRGFSIEGSLDSTILRSVISYNTSSANVAAGISFASGTNTGWEVKDNQLLRNSGNTDANSYGIIVSSGSNNLFSRNVALSNGPTTPVAANQLSGVAATSVTTPSSLTNINAVDLPWTNLALIP